MKKTIFFFTLVALSMSCSKTSTTTVTPTPTANAVNAISFKLNGIAAKGVNNSASYQFIQLMLVSASDDFLTKLDVSAVISGKVGTYDIKDNAHYLAAKKLVTSVYGTLSVTKFDQTTRLTSGTFSFTTQDSTKITEGVFTDVAY